MDLKLVANNFIKKKEEFRKIFLHCLDDHMIHLTLTDIKEFSGHLCSVFKKYRKQVCKGVHLTLQKCHYGMNLQLKRKESVRMKFSPYSLFNTTMLCKEKDKLMCTHLTRPFHQRHAIARTRWHTPKSLSVCCS